MVTVALSLVILAYMFILSVAYSPLDDNTTFYLKPEVSYVSPSPTSVCFSINNPNPVPFTIQRPTLYIKDENGVIITVEENSSFSECNYTVPPLSSCDLCFNTPVNLLSGEYEVQLVFGNVPFPVYSTFQEEVASVFEPVPGRIVVKDMNVYQTRYPTDELLFGDYNSFVVEVYVCNTGTEPVSDTLNFTAINATVNPVTVTLNGGECTSLTTAGTVLSPPEVTVSYDAFSITKPVAFFRECNDCGSCDTSLEEGFWMSSDYNINAIVQAVSDINFTGLTCISLENITPPKSLIFDLGRNTIFDQSTSTGSNIVILHLKNANLHLRNGRIDINGQNYHVGAYLLSSVINVENVTFVGGLYHIYGVSESSEIYVKDSNFIVDSYSIYLEYGKVKIENSFFTNLPSSSLSYAPYQNVLTIIRSSAEFIGNTVEFRVGDPCYIFSAIDSLGYLSVKYNIIMIYDSSVNKCILQYGDAYVVFTDNNIYLEGDSEFIQTQTEKLVINSYIEKNGTNNLITQSNTSIYIINSDINVYGGVYTIVYAGSSLGVTPHIIVRGSRLESNSGYLFDGSIYAVVVVDLNGVDSRLCSRNSSIVSPNISYGDIICTGDKPLYWYDTSTVTDLPNCANDIKDYNLACGG